MTVVFEFFHPPTAALTTSAASSHRLSAAPIQKPADAANNKINCKSGGLTGAAQGKLACEVCFPSPSCLEGTRPQEEAPRLQPATSGGRIADPEVNS